MNTLLKYEVRFSRGYRPVERVGILGCSFGWTWRASADVQGDCSK